MKVTESTSNYMYGYKANTGEETEYSLANRDLSQPLTDIISSLNSLPQESAVLDLGCGDGVIERHTRTTRRYSFTSIDLEPTAIQSLQNLFAQDARNPNDTALVGSITDLTSLPEIQDKTFAAAIAWRVLHGIAPTHYAHIFQSVHALLKPDASFFVSVAANTDWKAAALGDAYDPAGVNDCSSVMFDAYGIARSVPFPVHFFSLDELTALGEENGFTVGAVHEFQEQSGYEHIQREGKMNSYLFVEFIAK